MRVSNLKNWLEEPDTHVDSSQMYIEETTLSSSTNLAKVEGLFVSVMVRMVDNSSTRFGVLYHPNIIGYSDRDVIEKSPFVSKLLSNLVIPSSTLSLLTQYVTY